MRKKLLQLTTIAMIMFLGACSNDVLNEQSTPNIGAEAGRTISLTATMPGDNPTTRVDLKQEEDLSITLKWKDGDKLDVVFVQGTTKISKHAMVKNISDDGLNAQFDIELPAEIESGSFDLYGVYGGEGISQYGNLTHAQLPYNLGVYTASLDQIQFRQEVMLYFASKGIETTNPVVSADFKHLGSLFNITLKNTSGTSLEGLAEARLVGVGGDGKWAYNVGDSYNLYDLVKEEFVNIETLGNYISFKAERSSLAAGGSMSFWGWYPPLPEKNWPELKLELRNASDAVIYTSATNKPARTEATAAGKTYYIGATWDGSLLDFHELDLPKYSVGKKVHSGTVAANNDYFTREKILMQRNPDGDIIFYEIDGTGQFAQTNKIDGYAPWTKYRKFFYVAPKFFMGVNLPAPAIGPNNVSSHHIVDGELKLLNATIGAGFNYPDFLPSYQTFYGKINGGKLVRWITNSVAGYWLQPTATIFGDNFFADGSKKVSIYEFKALLTIDANGFMWKRDIVGPDAVPIGTVAGPFAGTVSETASKIGENWGDYIQILPFEDQLLGIDSSGGIWLHDLNLEDYWIAE